MIRANPCAINRLRATPSISPPFRQSPSEEYRVASGLATPRLVAGALQSPSQWQYCRPVRLVQRDIRPVPPSLNQTGGNPRHRRQEFSARPVQDGCADEPRSPDSRICSVTALHQFANLLRARHADRIGQRNHLQVFDFEQFECVACTSSTFHRSPYGLPNAMEI